MAQTRDIFLTLRSLLFWLQNLLMLLVRVLAANNKHERKIRVSALILR